MRHYASEEELAATDPLGIKESNESAKYFLEGESSRIYEICVLVKSMIPDIDVERRAVEISLGKWRHVLSRSCEIFDTFEHCTSTIGVIRFRTIDNKFAQLDSKMHHTIKILHQSHRNYIDRLFLIMTDYYWDYEPCVLINNSSLLYPK